MLRKNDVAIEAGKPEQKLSRNRVKCRMCGTILESTHVHDFRACECPNQAMVDGGLEYARWGGVDMGAIELMHEYVSKDTFLWGVLDLETHEIIHKPLAALSDAHMQNLALHLRTRHLPREAVDAEYQELAKCRAAKYQGDTQTLREHILPELERRGLREVSEQIPF